MLLLRITVSIQHSQKVMETAVTLTFFVIEAKRKYLTLAVYLRACIRIITVHIVIGVFDGCLL